MCERSYLKRETKHATNVVCHLWCVKFCMWKRGAKKKKHWRGRKKLKGWGLKIQDMLFCKKTLMQEFWGLIRGMWGHLSVIFLYPTGTRHFPTVAFWIYIANLRRKLRKWEGKWLILTRRLMINSVKWCFDDMKVALKLLSLLFWELLLFLRSS